MALSDACFKFLEKVREAAIELAQNADWYGAPDYPIAYGEEVDALRRACQRIMEGSWNPEDGAALIRLAHAVQSYYDATPDAADLQARRHQLDELVRLFKDHLPAEDANEAERAVPEIVKDTAEAERAAHKLRGLVEKLGKGAYDVAVRIISDIASETVKKILGLG
jgi:hypothetical protein